MEVLPKYVPQKEHAFFNLYKQRQINHFYCIIKTRRSQWEIIKNDGDEFSLYREVRTWMN